MIAQTTSAAANAEKVLYTLNNNDTLYISAIHVCNPTGAAATFGLAIKPTGAEAFASSVLFNSVKLEPNETFSVGAIAIDRGASIVIKGSTAGLVFTLTGSPA